MDRLGTDSRKRVRVRKACLPCASRKRKCDGTFPCATCRGYGYECQYRSTGAKSSRLDTTPVRGQGPTSLQQSNYLDRIALAMADNERAFRQVPTPSRGPELPEQVQETSHGLLVVSPTSKYLGRHSAQAFPRFLGLKMQSQVLPKLQPFAWNMEIRPKAAPKARPALSSLITLDAARAQLNSFFRSKFPACSFLDLDMLSARCEQHWTGQLQGLPFEALICGKQIDMHRRRFLRAETSGRGHEVLLQRHRVSQPDGDHFNLPHGVSLVHRLTLMSFVLRHHQCCINRCQQLSRYPARGCNRGPCRNDLE